MTIYIVMVRDVRTKMSGLSTVDKPEKAFSGIDKAVEFMDSQDDGKDRWIEEVIYD